MIKFTEKLANKIDNILKGFSELPEEEIVEKLINSKPKNFKEIYCQGEFYNLNDLYIYNKNSKYGDIMCFLILSKTLDINRVVDILNGKSKEYYDNAVIRHKINIVLYSATNGGKLITRGWGHLTGKLSMPSELAAKVQDDFIKWAYDKLTGKIE